MQEGERLPYGVEIVKKPNRIHFNFMNIVLQSGWQSFGCFNRTTRHSVKLRGVKSHYHCFITKLNTSISSILSTWFHSVHCITNLLLSDFTTKLRLLRILFQTSTLNLILIFSLGKENTKSIFHSFHGKSFLTNIVLIF